ncbi:MAG: CheR family methyltransferase [Cyclobacteriaceae bacterium]
MNTVKKNNLKAIVGIGASAGGLESLQLVLSHLPNELNDITIIIAQHMSPTYDSKLVDLLARKTNLPVVAASNGARLVTNTIYIAPPNHNIIIHNNSISLTNVNHHSPLPSVNELFISIANCDNEIEKIGVVLSGTGNDGTTGLKAIKQAGGIAVAQTPESAKYPGMPSSAIEAGNVDIVKNPDEIGQILVDLILHKQKYIKKEVDNTENGITGELLNLLTDRVGIDFSNYKTSTIHRRLEKTMSDRGFTNIQYYLEHIRKNPEEIDQLFFNLLIGVTKFFRDQEAFRKLKVLLNELVDNNDGTKVVRVWIAGCASGEEAYSIAIIFDQLLRQKKFSFQVQIFATDINEKALVLARKGIYSSESLSGMDGNLITTYFSKKADDTYQLAKHIRKMVLFSKHDVTSNPPFLHVDLISCRNLLIYFDNLLQQQIIPVFHYSLKNDGYLFLGKSETIGEFDYMFSTVDAKCKIFCKQNTTNTRYKLPYIKQLRNVPRESSKPIQHKEKLTIQQMVKETFYQTFEHPYVVTDERYNLIEVTGELKNLLYLRTGSASMSILKLIHPDLQIEIRSVLVRAIRKGEIVKGNLRHIKMENGKSIMVRLIAKPLLFSHKVNPLYLVIFQELDLDKTYFRNNENKEDNENPRLLELEQELIASREHMNNLVEELETYNEELQSTNEELQSSNEELQASNEELETTNEELQSTNEELEIAYSELRQASAEIERQNKQIRESEGNLKTVFNNTLQGFILVDDKYTIKTFNKTAYQIFETTYGRSINTGMSIIDVFEPEELEDFHRNFKSALQGNLIHDKILIKNAAHNSVWLEYNYTPVVEEDEKISNINISFIDSSIQNALADERDKLLEELKIKNRELKNSNKNLDNFFHVIAHDLRSPISNLRLALHQLASADEDEIDELLEIMDIAIERLDNTITGLIRILEIESESMINEDLNVKDEIEEICNEMQDAIQSSGAEIKLDVGEHRISYIREFFRSILKNLLSNAIKYSYNQQNPVIELKWSQLDGYHVLKIKDNGVGIDLQKYGNRLFKPFKRIKDNKKIGLGVGLHIVKTMAERNGGHVEVASELGKGTTFTVFLKPYTNNRG